jgi:multidrug efflux pump
MNLSAPFIHRPVATTLLTVAVALAGAIAFNLLPVSPLPQVDFPAITVQANLPGASPEIMASSVATPLERQFTRIAGLAEMTSTSTLGSTSIALEFDLSRNIDGAARDVQAAINAARAYLPSNLPNNPTYRKVNPADAPIVIMALTSTIYDRGQMYDAASTILEQRLSQIDGVGQVLVGGSSLPAVRVETNPTQLNSYGLSLQNVASQLNLQNVNRPKGEVANDTITSSLAANDQLLKAEYYRPLVVGFHNGAPVTLSDVADVIDSVQDVRNAGFADGKAAVLLIIFKQPQANIIDTVERVRAALPALKASIPAGIDTTITLDRTTTIRASVREVEITLCVSVILVILVVFVFLRNPRATLVPSVAVPVSLIGTFAVMYLFGYSIDNLSLMALTISTGFVVDDAIVVIENITRHLEQGTPPMEAALRGASEIGFTVLSISLSLVTVFLPILLMGGLVGRLFREFAMTLSIAILLSMVVSLVTTPMMCARLLRREAEEAHGRAYRTTGRVFDWLVGRYERSLDVVLRHPAITLAAFFITLALTIALFVIVPKGFFPVQDNGVLIGTVLGNQEISFQAMEAALANMVKVVQADPAVAHVIAVTGGTTGTGTDTGRVFITLKPLEQRRLTASQVINRLRRPLSRVSNATLYLQSSQDLRISARLTGALYQYTILSDNLPDLNKWGPILQQELKRLPGFSDVNSDQRNNGLQANLVYDRATASRVGLTPQRIDNALYLAFGQAEVSTIFTPLNQYYVVLEAAPQYWQSPQGLRDIYLQPTNSSAMVPLFAATQYVPGITPVAVNHSGLFPSVTISFNLGLHTPLSQAVQHIAQSTRRLRLPSSIHESLTGTLQAFQSSLATQPILIVTALMAVYIVLGILYESLIHPVTILSTLPSAGVGAVLALMLCRMELTIIALIGLILLIGIVKKNAILMIDFALAAERQEGRNPKDAIFEACRLRFRPILMTTLAAMFGALPLVLFHGIGSELRRPLGVTIVGGLMLSQILTLYTTPVLYLYLDRLRLWRPRNQRPSPQ